MTVDQGVDITKAGDRGVLKRIIKEGDGPELPSPGCQVTVHYTGTLLNGDKFDSSRDRDEPFSFQLGKGSVIKAWDIGVATMKKGEVCVLSCAPEYAYGAQGSMPKIPPNSVLQFEVEMISWEKEDLSPGKTKGILREILEPGVQRDSPTDGASVTVELEGRLLPEGKTFDSRTVTFSLGEGSEHNICDGLERALEKFTSGEKSRLTLQPKYAFKSEGNKDLGVPPNSTLEYVVKLTKFENTKDFWTLENQEKVDHAVISKEKGTTYFKQNKLPLALKMYKRVLKYSQDVVENALDTEEEIKKQAQELALSAHLNLALVFLKVEPVQYLKARDHATDALKIEPENVKGLFRRGQALLGLGEAQLAIADFQKVLAAEPTNKAAANQLALSRAALQKQKKKEQQLYANMFDKFARHDDEVEKLQAKQADVIGGGVGEWGAGEGEWSPAQRARAPTDFERENPNVLLLDKDGTFQGM